MTQVTIELSDRIMNRLAAEVALTESLIHRKVSESELISVYVEVTLNRLAEADDALALLRELLPKGR